MLRVRRLFANVSLAALPIFLCAVCYYKPIIRDGVKTLGIFGDANLYPYLLSRMPELKGRYWELAEDLMAGQPYPTSAAGLAGIFEGIDLLCISTFTARFLDPFVNYHAMIILVLIFNGWIFGYFTYKLTQSYLWAAVAMTLITTCHSTASRMYGHLNLFKHGWILLCVLAFSKCLDRPSLWAGLLLGFSTALVLQGSFYMGYLMALSLGIYVLTSLVAGRLNLKHIFSFGVALIIFLELALLILIPVFMIWQAPLHVIYDKHPRSNIWYYSAELWQYLVSPHSEYWSSLKMPQNDGMEGTHYPGLTILIAIAFYLIARLRRIKFGEFNPLLDRLMGISALGVLLSLTGGPSAFLYDAFGCFQSYGRGGLISVALWCFAAPMVFAYLSKSLRHRLLQLSLVAIVIVMTARDAELGRRWFQPQAGERVPAWVPWIKKQDTPIRLVTFPRFDRNGKPAMPWWEWTYIGLSHRVLVNGPVFSGADWILLNQDLKRLGASYERMTPLALRFIVSLGYDTVILDHNFVLAYPWVKKLPWLNRIALVENWRIYKVVGDTWKPWIGKSHWDLQGHQETSTVRIPSLKSLYAMEGRNVAKQYGLGN